MTYEDRNSKRDKASDSNRVMKMRMDLNSERIEKTAGV